MPCDLIGQAIVFGAAMISAALIWCARTWAEARKTLAALTQPDQEHTP